MLFGLTANFKNVLNASDTTSHMNDSFAIQKSFDGLKTTFIKNATGHRSEARDY